MSDAQSTTTNPAEIIATAMDSAEAALRARGEAITAAYDALTVASHALKAASDALKAANYGCYDAARIGAVDAEAIVVRAMKVISSC